MLRPMKLIRWFVGSLILFFDRVFSPRARSLSAEERARAKAFTANLSLYEYRACPFCVKVRRFLKAESLELPVRDAKREPFREELLEGGGKLQVPCLRIEAPNGATRWLYESGEIIRYLREGARA